MPKFPVDGPRDRVLRALQCLGFELIREGNHLALARMNEDGTLTPRTMPDHRLMKGSTLRLILRQSEISRGDFLEAYEER